MAYVQPLSEEEAISACPSLEAQSERFKKQFGFIPNSIRTMARRPELVDGFLALQQGVMTQDGTVPFELKKLISHIASKAAGCIYCQAHTTYTSGRSGVAAERLEKLWEYRSSDLFTEAERAAFDFAMAGASTPNGVTDETAETLREYWSDDQIVEILGVVAFFGFLNRWNDSMATELEDPAEHFASDLLGDKGWEVGKHA